MRRITLWLLATVTVVVLLFSYRTSTGAGGPAALTAPLGAAPPGPVAAPGPVNPPAPETAGSRPPTTPRPGRPSPPAGQPAPAPSASAPAPTSERVNGTVADTRWGPVQVQVTLIGHRITDVRALVYPSGNGHDQQVNAYALPRLRRQALTAQSARINGVSGATVTSDGYRRSLQAALDAAGAGH